MTAAGEVDPAAWALALTDLPGMGPVRLHGLIATLGPRLAWEAVCAGDEVRPSRTGGPLEPWALAARRADPPARLAALEGRGIGIAWPGHPDWPAPLARDPKPPGVLFWRGDLAALRTTAVAVVGSRHATAEGRAVAYELGRDLTAAGVTVVSGLALGVDGAAHAGALEAIGGPLAAAPVGVAASGVDVAYPRRHAELWSRVAGAGAIISETPPGGAATGWRFPMRNRIIAALAAMVVVVESQERGGSLVTAEAALDRGVDLGAVPGSVHSPLSAGTNRLLVEGAKPVRHAGDVLDGLGLTGRWTVADDDRRAPVLTAELRSVLDAVDWHPTAINRIVERCRLPIGVAGGHLERLRSLGQVIEEAGRWTRWGGGRQPPQGPRPPQSRK